MTAPMGEARLAEFEALEAAATAGPWRREDDRIALTRWVTDERGVLDISFGYVGNNTQDDARFVAEARTAVPELVEEVRRQRAERDQILALIESSAEAWLTTPSANMRAALALLRGEGPA